jgi:fumarate reductase subunit C
MKSYRKPYIREVSRSWWMSDPFYIKYMIREATAVLNLIVSIELLIFCLIAAIDPNNAERTISDLIQSPAIIILNIIALIAAMYHAITWFNLMPKAVRIFQPYPPQGTRLIPAAFYIIMLWCITLLASAIIALVLIFAV